MKTKIIPFDLDMAKKIQAGEIEGKIKTRDLETTMIIVCYDSTARYCDTLQPIIAQDIEECTALRAYDKNGAYVKEEHPKDLVLEVPDNEPQEPRFKPFDKVLVRDWENEDWIPALFGYSYIVKGSTHYRAVGGAIWMYCIPYEGNENLLGTTDKPKED